MALIQVNKLQINCPQYVEPFYQYSEYGKKHMLQIQHVPSFTICLTSERQTSKDQKLHLNEEPNVMHISKTSFLEL